MPGGTETFAVSDDQNALDENRVDGVHESTRRCRDPADHGLQRPTETTKQGTEGTRRLRCHIRLWNVDAHRLTERIERDPAEGDGEDVALARPGARHMHLREEILSDHVGAQHTTGESQYALG